MTGVEVATRTDQQQMTTLSNDQLTYIANTEFVPPGLRGNLPAILACVATGRALGIADMTALRSIHIIDGKATYSAELMVMLARQRGHSIQGEVSEGAAKVIGKRADNGDTMTVEWTLAMADRAGLLGKSNWKKYPESMLWARAVSQLCRELFADCFAGATYTTEELGADETEANGAPADSAAGTPFSYDHEEPLDPPLEQVLSGSAGVSQAVEGAVTPPVAQAPTDGVPAPPADQMPSDAPPSSPASEGTSKRDTTKMKKKLDVLVGKLRPEHLSTLQLWQSMGREPVLSEDGLLHWKDLRESLTWDECMALIDRLETYAADKLAAVGPVGAT